MGQIVSTAAKPKRCNKNQLSQVPTPAAGEHILVSSDNSMNAAGQGNFDCYIVGDGTTAAKELELKTTDGLRDISVLKSTNLYNNSARTENYYYWIYGPQANSVYMYSDYIPVEEGKTYSFQNLINKVRAIRNMNYIVAFNASKTVLSSQSKSNVSTYTVAEGSGVKYIIFTITKVQNIQSAFVEGTEVLPYEEYFDPIINIGKIKESLLPDVTFDKIAFKAVEAGKNKLNPAEIVDDAYINRSTGALVSDDRWGTSATPYIAVNKSGLYFNKANSAGVWGGAVYNSSKTYIRACDSAYNYVEGDAYVRWTLLTADKATAQVEIGNTATSYEPYTEREVIDPDVLPSSSVNIEEVASQLAGEGIFRDTIEISLPDKIHAVVGDTLQVFFNGCIRTADAYKYNVNVICSKGKIYRRYWEYTPASADVGTTSFRLYVTDDNSVLVADKTIQLVTSSTPTNPSTTKKIMAVGDSFTVNGIWPAEAYRRLTGSGGTPVADGLTNISFVGLQTRNGAGFIGKSGWSWYDYTHGNRAAFRFTLSGSPELAMGAVYTNNSFYYEIIEIIDDTILCLTSSSSNTPQASGTLTKTSGSGDATLTFTAAVADAQNPFWDSQNNKVSFTSYVDNYCGGSVDAVYVLLGANGLVSYTTEQTMTQVKDFADALHRDYPSCKLMLMGVHYPSMVLRMPIYGANGGYAATYWVKKRLVEINDAYQAFANDPDYSSFVVFVSVASQLDSDYNFPITEKAVNTRNSSKTEPYANNGVHPSDAGYLQIADVAYRSIVAEFCQ